MIPNAIERGQPQTADYERIPQELRNIKRWVNWRLVPDKETGKDKKVPYNPLTASMASTKNPATWTDFQAALTAMKRYNYSGIGFVFSSDDDITGVDIDHCYNPATGQFSDTAMAILAKRDTYAEFSPSGTGVHLYYHGDKPKGACKKTDVGVEMYNTGRFFTVTGMPLSSSTPSTLADSAGALTWIHETYLAKTRASGSGSSKAHARSADLEVARLTDEEVLSHARLAKNGSTFNLLYAGDWQNPALVDKGADPDKPRYASQSEADLAFVSILAFWTQKDKVQIDRLFRDSGLMRPKWDEKHHDGVRTYGEETIERACGFVDSTYDPSDAPVFEANGRYYRTRGESTYQMTNFTFKPVEMIVSDEETQLTADLVSVNGKVFRQTFMTSDFANLQKFKNILNKRTIDLTYTGSEGDLELLKGYIAELEWAVKRGVKAAGIYLHGGRAVFVTAEAAIEAGGLLVPDIVQLEKYESIKTDILNANVLSSERFAELGQWLLSYNEPAKTVSILAWTAGCFLKPYLVEYGVKFPHLFLIGEAGSGKSNTLEKIILVILCKTRVIAAGQVTAFTLMKDSASSNMVPQALDEFKPSKIDKMRLNVLYNHFRDSYDGHEGQRGRADQSTVFYELLAPLVVAGEESADEAAIRERSIELLFSKKDLKDLGNRNAFRQLCSHSELLEDFGRSLLNKALSMQPSEAQGWYEEALGSFSRDLPSRVTNNLACCAAGLRLVEKLVDDLGLSWDLIFPYSLDACRKYLEYAAKAYLLDGGTSNRSIVDETFEIMARMPLNPQSDYALSEDGKVLTICLNSVYDQYTKYRREYAVVGEVLNYGQFVRQLKVSDVYIDGSCQLKRNGKNLRAWSVDFELLKTRCDVAGFERPVLVQGD